MLRLATVGQRLGLSVETDVFRHSIGAQLQGDMRAFESTLDVDQTGRQSKAAGCHESI
jgi:hypothetical protein